jgi:outer membrane protein OmpA-like peptidoglycan-associated protein
MPQGAGVGDPRLGAMVRLYGQTDESPFSVHLGAQVFIPLHTQDDPNPSTRSDEGVRFLSKLVLAGYSHHVRWAFNGGLLYRPLAQLGGPDPAAVTTGSELQLGASLYYTDKGRRFAIGPEAVMATLISPNYVFQQGATSLEVLLGLHYHLAKVVMLSLGGGVGILHQAGTPDGRFLFRIAYAPLSRPAPACAEPAKMEPPLDRDHDGVPDAEDRCPELAAGDHPDPARPGCPLPDSDGDGVYDHEDLCPTIPAGAHPDPQRKGCPLSDRDGDGVYDPEDLCPDTPAGPHPDPQRPGCPMADSDGDGIPDSEDQCPNVPAGDKPDPERKGCPLIDRDHDGVPDASDACPDVPGVKSSDPKQNGCPALIEVTQGEIKIKQEVLFGAFSAKILPESLPVLLAVAQTLRDNPQIKKIEVQGHTDNEGDLKRNMDISQRRAVSVAQFLWDHGVDPDRLMPKGYGPTRPIADNHTHEGRVQNRRVQFVILNPPPAGTPNR